MSSTLLSVVLSILPGIAISVFIYYKDIYDKEPHRYLISCFIFGMLSTIPALELEQFGESLGFKESDNVFITLIFAFIVVAGSEEFVKFMFLRFYIYPKNAFDEPMDGIVYAVMIGMGFATLENILYVMNYGLDVALIRMFTAVPAHAAFAVIMGYFVGIAKFRKSREQEKRFLRMGFLSALLLHGVYDFFLFQKMYESLAMLAFVALFGGIYVSRRFIQDHQEHSPFRVVAVAEEEIKEDEEEFPSDFLI